MARQMPKPAGYHWDVAQPVLGGNGRPSCRWCKRDVEPPRRSWCGDDRCVLEWTRRTSWPITRGLVFERDKGVCQICGLDTVQLRKEYTEAMFAKHMRRYVKESLRARDEITIEVSRQTKIPIHAIISDADWWQADHIQPVSEGGDWFDMSNLRTLCIPCHSRVTAALAAHRAKRRQREKLREGC